jgi:hypothetical protein
VRCDLGQYYRDFEPISAAGEGKFRDICLSVGMSCNSTCGWENDEDESKTRLLR